MRALLAAEYTKRNTRGRSRPKSFAPALLAWYSCTNLSSACGGGSPASQHNHPSVVSPRKGDSTIVNSKTMTSALGTASSSRA